MQITDPIADMLTRIRNANTAKHETVDIPASNDEEGHRCRFFVDEGYIKGYQLIEDGTPGCDQNHPQVLSAKKRSSQDFKPSIRSPVCAFMRAVTNCPRCSNGLGIAIVSTSKGIMTDKKAREANVGGEVLAFVW